ncbi:MAG TPA: thioesterase family protein [Methylomirabilota bacterium]|nr:thioesterase family protein [Methylomirabilota bacterium]
MALSIHRHQHRVTYADCTVGNHVYHGRYLELLEAARGEFFRHLGVTFLDWQNRQLIFPVVECRLRFRTPARYDDVLTIDTWLSEARKVRLIFCYRLANQNGQRVLDAETVHLATNLEDKMTRLPAELLGRLAPYVQAAEVAPRSE